MSTRMDGGVRDIARAIERQVTDGLIEARADGAKTIRLRADGEKVLVAALPASDQSLAPSAAAASTS